MPYNWSQLAFVEKWRRHAVRGQIVGMYRPQDRTFFDLRLRPGGGGAGQLPGTIELRLQDAGDLIREKRMGLLDRVPVVVRVVASPGLLAGGRAAVAARPASGSQARWLDRGSRIAGKLLALESETVLLDAGLPLVVQLPEGEVAPNLKAGESVEFTVSETPKGFIVV